MFKTATVQVTANREIPASIFPNKGRKCLQYKRVGVRMLPTTYLNAAFTIGEYTGSVNTFGIPNDGVGTVKYSNGDSYTGTFVRGERHGKGVLKYANGNCYTGGFSKDRRHGDATMKYAGGKATFKGKYVDGNRCAEGTLTIVKISSDGQCFSTYIYVGELDAKRFEGLDDN